MRDHAGENWEIVREMRGNQKQIILEFQSFDAFIRSIYG